MLASASDAATALNDKFTIKANKKKFRTLPDEILAIIFEMACQDPFGSVNSLSAVSPRFRKIILSLPRLWSWISSPLHSVQKAKLIASRATLPTISLSISGAFKANDSERARVTGMYELAVSISSRIQKMSLSLTRFDPLHLQQHLSKISVRIFPNSSLNSVSIALMALDPRINLFVAHGICRLSGSSKPSTYFRNSVLMSHRGSKHVLSKPTGKTGAKVTDSGTRSRSWPSFGLWSR